MYLPHSKICLLPLKLSQGAFLLQDPEQSRPSTAGFVQAGPSSTETAVHPSDQGHDGPDFSAQHAELGVREPRWAREVVCRRPDICPSRAPLSVHPKFLTGLLTGMTC